MRARTINANQNHSHVDRVAVAVQHQNRGSHLLDDEIGAKLVFHQQANGKIPVDCRAHVGGGSECGFQDDSEHRLCRRNCDGNTAADGFAP